MSTRRSLAQILNDADKTNLRAAWENTQAAGELAPLPAGEYTARILSGELDTARTGTLGYKLTFEVLEGDHAGRHFWHDVWLTPAALPMAKRDLLKLGITDLDMLDKPLPPGIRVKAKVALRKNDDGTEHNRVKTFEVTGVEPPDPFAPGANGNPMHDDGAKGGDDDLPT